MVRGLGATIGSFIALRCDIGVPTGILRGAKDEVVTGVGLVDVLEDTVDALAELVPLLILSVTLAGDWRGFVSSGEGTGGKAGAGEPLGTIEALLCLVSARVSPRLTDNLCCGRDVTANDGAGVLRLIGIGLKDEVTSGCFSCSSGFFSSSSLGSLSPFMLINLIPPPSINARSSILSEAGLKALGGDLSLDVLRCPTALLDPEGDTVSGTAATAFNLSARPGLGLTGEPMFTPESCLAGSRLNVDVVKTSRLGSFRSGVRPNACRISGEAISSGLSVRGMTETRSESFLVGAVLLTSSGLFLSAFADVSMGASPADAFTGDPGGLTNLAGGLWETIPPESNVDPGVNPAFDEEAAAVLNFGGCPTSELMSINGFDGLDRLDRLELLDIALPGRRGGTSLANGASSSESDEELSELDASVLLRGSSEIDGVTWGNQACRQKFVPRLTVGLETVNPSLT